jgi:hypothetical protein
MEDAEDTRLSKKGGNVKTLGSLLYLLLALLLGGLTGALAFQSLRGFGVGVGVILSLWLLDTSLHAGHNKPKKE